MPPDTRDAVVDYLTDWAEKTGIPMAKLLKWADVPKGKFHEWRKRYGKANEHNGKVPRDHWLEIAERDAIIDYYDKHPLNGYRRITFMMLDADVVAASPATVYRVLKAVGRLDRWSRKPSAKGTGLISRSGRTSTGMPTSRISTSPALSTTCAWCSTGIVAISCIGSCASR